MDFKLNTVNEPMSPCIIIQKIKANFHDQSLAIFLDPLLRRHIKFALKGQKKG